MEIMESWKELRVGDGNYSLFTDLRQMIIHMKKKEGVWTSCDDHNRRIIGFKSNDDMVGIRLEDCRKENSITFNVKKMFRTASGRMTIGELISI